MDSWLSGLLVTVGAPILIFLWQGLLRRETVYEWGRCAGVALSKLLGQRFGVAGGDSIEERFKSTVADFVDGLNQGLDEDDAAHPAGGAQ